MTTTVGQVLQRARTQRGIDLNEVERVTKVRVQDLRAMEEDRWEELAEPRDKRGLLETYARYLDLDPDELASQQEESPGHPDNGRSIPLGAIRPGGRPPSGRGPRPYALIGAGLAAVALLGVIIAVALGGSGGSSPERKPARSTKAQNAPTAGQPASSSQVSLDLRSTDDVWVCLIDADNRALVDETVPPGETRGPFDGRAFEVTFGNGSVRMTVDGQDANVPPLAEPLGYRITPRGIHRLDSTSQPTCT